MDTKTVKTFLEVARTGNFSEAAAHLNVAQTTVSARIRTLESQLGAPLFVREAAGASLSPTGERFLVHAPKYVQLTEIMINECAVHAGKNSRLNIGVEDFLSEEFSLPWILSMRTNFKDATIRVKTGSEERLLKSISDGSLDLAIMHAPPIGRSRTVDLIWEDKLGLFTTDKTVQSVAHPRFLYVDWGTEFQVRFDSHFPGVRHAAFSILSPVTAGRYILKYGGAMYGRMSQGHSPRYAETVTLVPDAPVIPFSVCAVRPAGVENELAAEAVREAVRMQSVGP